MKKTAFLLILILMLTFMLSACGGCSHEWKEATCMKPRTCAKCGETEGDALGHSWQEASCDTPKTCSVCGKTGGEALGHSWQEATCELPEICQICGAEQGQTLPHSYGKWSISGEEMVRSCKNCTKTEITALDRETYFMGNVIGYWDTVAVIDGGQSFSVYALGDNPGLSLYIGEDGSIRYDNSQKIFTGTYCFREYNQVDVNDYYYFDADFDGSGSLKLALCSSGDQEVVRILFEEYGFFLSDNLEYVDHYTGIWSSLVDGEMKELHLYEDRTFTGNLEFEIQGTWHIRPIKDSGGSYYAELVLSYGNEFTRENLRLRRSLGTEKGETAEMLSNPNYADLTHPRPYFSLRKTEPQILEKQKEELHDGIDAILGSWVSQRVSVMDRTTEQTQNTVLAGKMLSFYDDGTFQGEVDQKISGTWAFYEVRTYESDIKYHNYRLTLDGNSSQDYWSATVYDGNISISRYTEEEQIHYSFVRLRTEQPGKEGQETVDQRLIGTWNSTILSSYNNLTNTDTSSVKTDVSVIIREDGTVTVFMDEEKEGVWYLDNTMKNGEGTDHEYTTYFYKLMLTGEPEPFGLNVNDAEEYIVLMYTDETYNYRLKLQQLTEEEIEKIKQGPEKIVGTWTSNTVMETTEDFSGEEKYINTIKYSITILEDGTFESSLYEKGSGTWVYSDCREDTGYEYIFYYEGNPGYSYMYTLREEELFGWDKSGDMLVGFWMKKTKS